MTGRPSADAYAAGKREERVRRRLEEAVARWVRECDLTRREVVAALDQMLDYQRQRLQEDDGAGA